MAQLLRIPPAQANVNPEIGVDNHFIQRGFERLGAEIVDVTERIQAGADTAEQVKLRNEGVGELKTTLQDSDLNYNDPDEYLKTARDGIKSRYEAKISQASNEKVRRNLEATMADDLSAAYREADKTHWLKKKDRAVADTEDSLQKMTSAAAAARAAGNDVEAAGLMRGAGFLLGQMTQNKFYTNDMAADKRRAMAKTVETQSMTLIATKDPDLFLARQERGDFDGTDPIILKAGMDLAVQTTTMRAARDAAAGKKESNERERYHEGQAEKRQLNLAELAVDKRKYGWDDDKVKKLQAIQIGIKFASPFEEKILYDATESLYAEPRYTHAHIKAARDKLYKAAADGLITTDTPQWRAEISRMQNMTDRLDVRADVKDRTSEFGERQRIEDIFGFFFPGQRSDHVAAEVRRHKLELDKLGPAERRPYVDEVMRKLQAEFDKNKTPQRKVQGLRGALGDK